MCTSYYQVVRAQYCLPCPTYPTMSAADPHRCSTPTRGKLCLSGCQTGGTPQFLSLAIAVCFAARNSHCLQNFNISALLAVKCGKDEVIQNPLAGRLSDSKASNPRCRRPQRLPKTEQGAEAQRRTLPFNFSIQDPTTCHLSTFTNSIDILILSSLTMEHSMHRSHYSQVLYVVAVTNIAVAKS